MGEDSDAVRVWAVGKSLSWIGFLEAIFQTMQSFYKLHRPFINFSLITPNRIRSFVAFSWYLWTYYYQLSATERKSVATRDVIKKLVRKNIPGV